MLPSVRRGGFALAGKQFRNDALRPAVGAGERVGDGARRAFDPAGGLMFRFKLRIATKLGLAGGVALLTGGAIALNQSWDRQARAALGVEADNADAVRVATLTAAVATRRVVIMGRDIRLAMSEGEVDEVLKRANAFGAEGVKALESAAG